MPIQIKQTNDVRFRHLRKKNSKIPLATIATVEKSGKIITGFSFCDKADTFSKKEGRERACDRVQKFLRGKTEDFVFEFDRKTFFNLLRKLKTGKKYYSSVAYRKSIENFVSENS